MGKCFDFIISFFFPLTLPYERRFNISNTNRVYVLWFVLVAIFLTAGLALGLGKFHSRTIVPVPDEMYYVDWYRNDFCSNINITTKWPLRVNAFLLDRDSSNKALCHQNTEIIAGPISSTIPARGIYTTKVNLLEGDRISGQICMSSEEKIYIFTRQMDFLNCILGDSWVECGLRGPTRYRVESNCKDFDNFDNPFFLPPQSISNAGGYYFVFFNSLSTTTRVSARFTKTIFNEGLLKKAKQSCHDQTICALNLGSTSQSEVACFEVVRNTPFHDREVGKDVNVGCKPRLWLYFMLFFILPIFIGIIGSVLICLYCKRIGSCDGGATGVPNSQSYTASSRSQRNSPPFSLRNESVAASSHGGNNVSSRFRSTHRDIDLEDINAATSGERDSANANRNNLRQANSDPPPSYDEAMKAEFV